jgi:hypothetical protein
MLNYSRRNETIDGAPDRYPLLPEISMYRSTQFECRLVFTQINEIVELLLGSYIIPLLSNSLKNLSEYETANAKILAIADQLHQFLSLQSTFVSEEIDPYRGIHENPHEDLPFLICSRSPSQFTFPLSFRSPNCDSRLTN